MDKHETKKQYKDEKDEIIYNHREYNINNDNNNYILRLEINEKNIYFIISLDDNIEYNYKTNMNLSTLVNKLELNSIKYNNFELILDIFDKIYENKDIIINILDDETCLLIINFINVLEKEKYEIKLNKNYMKSDDKFNFLFNQIKLLKNNKYDNDKIEEMNNKINELNNELDKKNEEIKDIINQKDIIIDEINQKLINLERRIRELENKNLDTTGKYENNLNNLFNKNEKDIKIMDLDSNNKNSKLRINKTTNNINYLKQQLNKSNAINSFKNIDRKDKNESKINTKFKDQENINNIITYNKEYENRMKYEFKKDPKNLKYKFDLITSNTDLGCNDKFEIYISYKDNQEYLVSPNSKTFNLDIFTLRNNQKILSLQKHKNIISSIRYFINNKNKNEYLISADQNYVVIIWDISNNYNIKYIIDTKYKEAIYSSLLIFPENMKDNFIITSTFNMFGNDEEASTKIYSFNDCKFIKFIKNTNTYHIYYLLLWYNKKNKKYYIIQFANMKILINNLLEDELYTELIKEPEDRHYSGFIYYKDNKDYLCSSSTNGYINIWDLYNKKIFKIINTDGCKLGHIINWNKKFIIVSDVNNKSFKIIDIENNSIYDIKNEHNDLLYCVKKINHPIYGESLLSAGDDKIIKLWTTE